MARPPTRETAKERAAREERERQDANATRRAEADATAARATADAEARKAEAQAKAEQARAQAEVDRMRAEAEALRIEVEADAAKRKSDAEEAARQAAEARAPVERAYQLGINVGAPVAGYVAGVQLAKNIGAKHAAGVAAANKQLKALGTQIARTIPKTGMPKPATIAKLTGMVQSADVLRLASRPTALGLATAGLVLAEGGVARFVLAPQAGDNKVAKEALGAVGTASIFAATTLVGKRLIANATTTALPDAKAVAAVETARKLLPAAPALAKAVIAAPSLVERAGKLAGAASKAKGPALILGAAGAAVAVSAVSTIKPAEASPAEAASAPAGGMLAKAAEVGLTSATTAQAARLAASPAARVAAGFLTKLALPLTAAAAVAGAVEGGRKSGTLTGALEGAADGVTGGGYSWAKDKVGEFFSRKPGAPGEAPLALMNEAARRTAAEMQRATVAAADALGPAGAKSDGQTDGYTRQRNGRMETVRGYATPTR